MKFIKWIASDPLFPLYLFFFGLMALMTIVFGGFMLSMRLEKPPRPDGSITQEINRVYQQQIGIYSFLVQDGNHISPYVIPYTGQYYPLYDVYSDVSKDKPMYIEADYKWGPYPCDRLVQVKIHIHSIDELEAGSYIIHGKPPKPVQSKVIE